MLAVTILGGVGWAVGAHIGMGTAWLLPSASSLIGVYTGWHVNRVFLD